MMFEKCQNRGRESHNIGRRESFLTCKSPRRIVKSRAEDAKEGKKDRREENKWTRGGEFVFEVDRMYFV